jgi:predicted acylesterase/phospholipase RssA
MVARIIAARAGGRVLHPAQEGSFLDLGRVLDHYEADQRRGKKLALAVTGGGARGAWEAGVIEALTQACRGRDIDIDVFVGSSVGSINAFCAFVDALAPAPALVQGVFAARQSALWKRYGSGNHAADDLLDRAWIVKYATDEWPLPIVGRFAALEQQLSDTWDRLKHHLDDIGRAAGDLRKAATNPPGSLTMETALAVRQLDADTAALLRHLHDLQNAWNSLHVADIFKDPRKFIRELDRVRIEVGNVWGDTLRVEVDLLAVPLSLVSDVMIDAIGYIGPLVKAVFDLLTAIAVVVGDAGELIGEAAAFVGLLEEALALLTLAAAVEAELLVGVGETAVLVNHIFTQNRIRSALTDFATQAIGPDTSVARAWLDRLGEHPPAFYVTGADESVGRQIIFGLDRVNALDAIAATATWIVDLSAPVSRRPPHGNLLVPAHVMEGDTVIEAVLTSSALPVVFEPRTWWLELAGERDPLQQVVVDGGVIDNSPLDVAVLAGATHVIVLELDPLVDTISPDPDKKRDKDAPGGLPQVIWATMGTAVDGSNNRGINLVVALNQLAPEDEQIAIYRLAPLIPRTAYDRERHKVPVSIELVDFDGAYNDHNALVMNLYDWFIQGYIDANGWGGADADAMNANDRVLGDYEGTHTAGFLHDPWWGRNKFWFCAGQPLPDLPTITAAIDLPDRRALADQAAARR